MSLIDSAKMPSFRDKLKAQEEERKQKVEEEKVEKPKGRRLNK